MRKGDADVSARCLEAIVMEISVDDISKVAWHSCFGKGNFKIIVLDALSKAVRELYD